MALVIRRAAMLRLRRKVFTHYAARGRKLPFRRTTDPYRIALSEVMLQQTQVERVVPKYREWLRLWPTWAILAKARPSEVIRAWSGLGYNRRALYMHEMGVRVMSEYGGKLPLAIDELRRFRGIGPYTARAILIFATNADLTTIDTNIRRVLIHELDLPPAISPGLLEEIAGEALPRGRSRDWHNALMDYAAMALPPPGQLNIKVPRQSRFEGSTRQLRGKIIRAVSQAPQSEQSLLSTFGSPAALFSSVVDDLVREGFLRKRKRLLLLPE